MGLFWSMLPADGQMANGLRKNGVEPTTVHLSVEVGDEVVAETELERLWVADGVERIEVREDGLVGTFFVPAGDGPFPGVLVFSGSGGGIVEDRAALLASHGFAAFALAYFLAEGLRDDLIDIPIEYFGSGFEWMRRQPAVRGDRLGIIGQSRGGELVLLLGSLFPTVGAVVAYVPSAVLWRGLGKESESRDTPPVAWTHRGAALPSMPARDGEVTLDIAEGDPIPLTPYFLKSLEYSEDIEHASIAVERIEAPVMLISGEADAMWPSTVMADMALQRLTSNGHPYPDVHLAYPDAGHGIRPPHVPTTVTATLHPVDGSLYALGGTPQGNARANAESWPRVLAFLHDHLAPGEPTRAAVSEKEGVRS
jgi:dienelactone hydrolase